MPEPLVRALTQRDITEPFPIQTDTLPDTLAGRDVLGRGKTGSGKTLAFSLPMAARLGGQLSGGRRRSGHPLGLVLAPTRELATQISAVLTPLAQAYGLTTTTIFGGVSQQRQVAALQAGVDIVVACPGRLEDLMQQGFVSLDAIEITVLDEADHMADLGFLPVVTRILKKTPTDGQRMLFSATLDNGVDKLVRQFLHNEVLHSVDDATSHVEAMTHHVFEVDGVESKRELVKALASGTGRRILFMRTKHQAKKLAKQLTEAGIPSVDLHGNLSQGARDRNLAAFGSGDVRVLVATDVAARGVHVDDVQLVVHVDPPAEHKAYLHRSGRTARAGSDGDVVTVVLPSERGDVKAMLRKAAIGVAPQQVSAGSPAVTALVGDRAPYVTPSVQATASSSNGSSGRGSNGRGSSSNGRGGSGSNGRSGGSNGRTAGSNGRGAGSGRSGSQEGRGQGTGRTAPNRPSRDHGASGSTDTSGRSSRRHRGGAGAPNSSRAASPQGVAADTSTGRGRGSRRARG